MAPEQLFAKLTAIRNNATAEDFLRNPRHKTTRNFGVQPECRG